MHLPDFTNHRVLVIGDLMLDRYWHGGTSRISPEAPVPVVQVSEIEERAGGAGNVALNIAALGAQVSLLGYRGEDEPGSSLHRLLDTAGIDCHLETLTSFPTITKLRVLSRHQQLIRLDFEENFDQVDPRSLQAAFDRRLSAANIVVLSDYGKGTLKNIESLIELAQRQKKPVLVDPKGVDFDKYRGATLLTPNPAEFESVAGPCRDDNDLVERGLAMLDRLNLKALLITRGEQGMTLIQRAQAALHLPTHAKEVYDVTGAGDTVIATLATGLSAGLSIADATRLANQAAGLAVAKLGTATISTTELAQAMRGYRTQQRGVIDLEALIPLLAGLSDQGERIVATNGCFDILHPGHVDYLQRARELGDRLVVLVNSDPSVQRLKGPERPINPLTHRMTMLAALECVDWVVPFEEDTPRDVIGRLAPDILVKGGDYTDIESIAGHDHVLNNGGEVRVLPFVEGHSTTGLIEKITGRLQPQSDDTHPSRTQSLQ
jgi:D-beta-D-heptose 7-phosphate kinase/D-beta-D-heptose 1-phosphate adenosyltransferase